MIEDKGDKAYENQEEDEKVESYEATKTISPIKKPEKKQGIEVSCQCGNSREGKWISIPRDDEDKNELKEISDDEKVVHATEVEKFMNKNYTIA